MNNTEWKSVIIDESYLEWYSPKCYRLHLNHDMNLRFYIFIPAKLCRFNDYGKCKISYLPHFDFAEKLEAFVAERENAKYEIAIEKQIIAAIGKVVDSALDDEADRLFNEWKDGRENTDDVRAFDATYLAKLGAQADACEKTESKQKWTARTIDPDKEEIIKHVPAPLTPVEIEADPELVR